MKNDADTPSNYFVSDSGFAIIRNSSSEASVALSGASGTSTYSADDYTFSFTVSPLNARINEAKTVTITPTVKRREISGSYTTSAVEIYNKSIGYDTSLQIKIAPTPQGGAALAFAF